MNYFYDLTLELQDIIINICNNNAANIIQKAIYKYNNRSVKKLEALLILSNNCYYFDEYYTPVLDIYNEYSVKIIEFIDKNIEKKSASYYIKFNTLQSLLNDIFRILYFEAYLGGPNAVYYNRFEKASRNIAMKLHFNKYGI